MVLDGAEATFPKGGEQLWDGAVRPRNLGIEVDERAGKLVREKASDGTLARPHETDEDEQRG